ncbi:MAG: TRAP transporter large permease subunit [Alphaproteobacteria bacterium]|nr:TRAP transporter large permease subunit [Alphaproteobacteria bacterium]
MSQADVAAEAKSSPIECVIRWIAQNASYLYLAATLATTYEVFARYVFNAPTDWAFEATIMLCSACYLVAGGFVTQRRRHIAITSAYETASDARKRTLDIVAILFGLLAVGMLILSSWRQAFMSLQIVERTGSSWNPPLPALLKPLIVLGSALIFVQLALQLRRILKPMQFAGVVVVVAAGVALWALDSYEIVPLWSKSFEALREGFKGLGIGWATLVVLAVMIALMLTGMPLAWVLLTIACGCTVLWIGPSGLPLVGSRVFGFVQEYVFVAVPLFVLMACIMERSGVAKDLYQAMYIFSGSLPGGVAMQTVVVAMIMAAMTGIIGGEIVLLGLIALPQMLRLGYDKKLAIGTICAGGSLGTMIPPSVVLIVYGLTASVSIGDLFKAAFLPGILMGTLYIVYILIRCAMDPNLGPPAPAAERNIPFARKLGMLKGLVLPLLIIFWVLGSIYFGIAAVTEAAGVGVAGAIVSAAIRGELNWNMLRESLTQTMETVGILIWLTFGAFAFIGIYNIMGGTNFVRQLITGLPVAPIVIVLFMMAILLVLGCLIDWIGICLLTMPIFVPIIKDLGYDPVWFGILFCMNMQVSYLSPPFGPACFYLKGVAPPEITLQQIFSSIWPFMGLQITALALVLFFPEIALFLPQLLD